MTECLIPILNIRGCSSPLKEKDQNEDTKSVLCVALSISQEKNHTWRNEERRRTEVHVPKVHKVPIHISICLPNSINAIHIFVTLLLCTTGHPRDYKWIGFTVISVLLREGQTLLFLAVVTSSVKHAFSLVRQVHVYIYRYANSLAHQSKLLPGFV